jgi:CheY-like chemotaxis protein
MKQLLVITRDSGVLAVFEAALDDIPCVVLRATDAAMALTHLQSKRVDLVFLDLQSFASDGLDLLQRLRSRGDPVPVFVVTAPNDLDLPPLQQAASRGLHYEIMRRPVQPGDIRAATTAVLATATR